MAQFRNVLAALSGRLFRVGALGLLLSPCLARPSPATPADDAYTVRKWTLDDGLPDSQVCGVVPGRDGYLWLATARHLVRFDGLRFVTVPLPVQAAVGRNEGIFQDGAGGLWIYGLLGAVRFADGVWWQSEAGGMPRGRVTSVTEGPDGTVYVAQERVLYAWRNGALRPILKTSSLADEAGSFRQLVWNRDGGLWIAAGDGLFCWSPEKAEAPRRMTDIRAEWVLLASPDQPLVAHGSFVCLRRKGETWERLPETKPVSVRCLFSMTDGSLWAGHDSGVSVCAGEAWHALSPGATHVTARVLGLSTDRESNVWLATTEGLVRLRRRVFQPVPVWESASASGVSALWVEGGQAWAGLRSGGVAVGDAGGLFPLALQSDFSEAVFNALYRESDGTLWCGGPSGNLWMLQDTTVQRIEGAYADDVRAILGKGGPPLWIATHRGVFAFNSDLNRLEEMAWPVDPVLAMWQDANGFLWAGHESLGLAVLRSGGRDEFLPGKELPGRTIRALCRDSEGVLWVGGVEGLARWEEGKRFVFHRSHGLWNESVRQISEDASGCLWLGTAGGIMRIAKRELAAVAAGQKELLEVRTFGAEAGMERESCTGGVFFPLGEPPRDRLWFPTSEGLVTVETRDVPSPRPAPEVRLVTVETGRLAEPHSSQRSLLAVRRLETSNPRDVRIEYTALDFSTPERVRFRYELAGPVSQRSGPTEERQVSFSRLPPGSYAFSVTACNGDGVWSTAGAALAWTVHPFFWETAGFRLWCLLAGCGIVALSVRTFERRRVRRRLEAAQRQGTLARERARIARDLHDEIGAKLTRLSLLGSMAAEDAKGAGALRREIEEMADTARETHRAFDEIVWSVSPRNDTVRSLSHYICKYAEEFFAGTAVRCSFQLPETIAEQPLDPQQRHQMFLAVKEGLNNVLKHASAARVGVSIRALEGHLCVELSDDGKGFDVSAAGATGDGLRNMRERMKAVGGNVSLESLPGKGTRLAFDMPLDSGGPVARGWSGERRETRL